MAGPNPYRLYSFQELRKGLGRSWLVCEPCRRYTPLLDAGDRDTRFTTFSCSVCGGEGKHVFEDPHKAGLQPDLRPRPARHPDAALRLRRFGSAARQEERRAAAARDAAWQRALRPKPEPRRVYPLKPFPCRSFGDLAAWGLAGTIGCRACRHQTPLEVTDALRDLPLLRTRLTCSAIRPATAASAATPCVGRGALWLSAHGGGGVPDDKFVSIACNVPDHTALDVSYILVEEPPRRGYLGRGENFERIQRQRLGPRMCKAWQDMDQVTIAAADDETVLKLLEAIETKIAAKPTRWALEKLVTKRAFVWLVHERGYRVSEWMRFDWEWVDLPRARARMAITKNKDELR